MKPSKKLIKQWRVEFENHFSGKYNRYPDGEYKDDATHRLWMGFVAAKTSSYKKEKELEAKRKHLHNLLVIAIPWMKKSVGWDYIEWIKEAEEAVK